MSFCMNLNMSVSYGRHGLTEVQQYANTFGVARLLRHWSALVLLSLLMAPTAHYSCRSSLLTCLQSVHSAFTTPNEMISRSLYG